MTSAVLVFNVGSSSLRCAVYASPALEPLCHLHIESINTARQTTSWSGRVAERFSSLQQPPIGDHAVLTSWLIDVVRTHVPDLEIRAVGHRVVHGGTRLEGPARIDASVIAEIEHLAVLAPNHQPQSLASIKAVMGTLPAMPQVACFDTAFHRRMPRLAQLFGLPRALSESGVLRYGFHGLSYEYLAGKLREIAGARANGRVILAHLGHGASLCALLNGHGVATSMGFSTLDGLMMGTRCGSIDPGVLLYLQETKGLAAHEVSDLLYNRSGLLGVSGISDDVRVLEASDDPRAVEALELFAYRIAREVGSLVAALGGLDVLVFSAGIGERSASMRKLITDKLRWLGIALDEKANAAQRAKISDARSAVDLFVIPTDEELVIARATQAVAMS